MRETHLKAYFESKGTITDVFVVYRGKKSRGFGYVTFESDASATAALELNGSKMPSEKEGEEPREISVVLAKPRDPEVEAAAKERLKAREEGKGSGKGDKADKPKDAKPKPKKEGGKGDKKPEDKKGKGKGGRGPKDGKSEEKPAPEKKKKEKNPNQLQFNVGPEHMDFLKAMAEKYEIKGLNRVAKLLLKFAADDPDNEVFAGAPAKPETLVRLRLTLSDEEIALLEKAQKDHSYDNRHLAVQALVQYVMPTSEDPAEKASETAMLDDIFKQEA